MSDRAPTLTPADWDKAHQALGKLVRDVFGNHEGHVQQSRFCIPPQADDDDVLVSEALKAGQRAEQERDELKRMLAEALRCGWHSLEGSRDGTFDDLTHAEIAAMRSHAFALVTGRLEDGTQYVYGTSEAIREMTREHDEQAVLAREWRRSWESVSQSYHDAKQDSWMLQERLGEQAALVEAAMAYYRATEAEARAIDAMNADLDTLTHRDTVMATKARRNTSWHTLVREMAAYHRLLHQRADSGGAIPASCPNVKQGGRDG